jgi:hypothetical protein
MKAIETVIALIATPQPILAQVSNVCVRGWCWAQRSQPERHLRPALPSLRLLVTSGAASRPGALPEPMTAVSLHAAKVPSAPAEFVPCHAGTLSVLCTVDHGASRQGLSSVQRLRLGLKIGWVERSVISSAYNLTTMHNCTKLKLNIGHAADSKCSGGAAARWVAHADQNFGLYAVTVAEAGVRGAVDPQLAASQVAPAHDTHTTASSGGSGLSCQQCGHAVQENYLFCPFCGSSLN